AGAGDGTGEREGDWRHVSDDEASLGVVRGDGRPIGEGDGAVPGAAAAALKRPAALEATVLQRQRLRGDGDVVGDDDTAAAGDDGDAVYGPQGRRVGHLDDAAVDRGSAGEAV